MSNTIVFMHGMFLNPRCFEHWMTFFDNRGFHCVAPAWPLHEGEPAELRRTLPAGLGELGLEGVVRSLRRVALDHEKPILIGHCLGGLVVQLLISQGIGSMGACLCPMTPNRMPSPERGFLRNVTAITSPLEGEIMIPDADTFHRHFANTMPREHSDVAYEKYATPESRKLLRDSLTNAVTVDLARPHAPLLFISADQDQIIPTELCRRNAEAYKDEASLTSFREFGGRGHFAHGQPGWEDIAEHVHGWILSNTEETGLRHDVQAPLTRAKEERSYTGSRPFI